MIRAVIDPGVLVSAFIGRTGSVADQIIRAWRGNQIELVMSPALLDEPDLPTPASRRGVTQRPALDGALRLDLEAACI